MKKKKKIVCNLITCIVCGFCIMQFALPYLENSISEEKQFVINKDEKDFSEIEEEAALNRIFSLDNIPSFNGITPYTDVNNGYPYFEEFEYITEPFEYYSELDSLGRCGVAYANICKEIMPTEERGAIGMVKPSGWNQKKYPDILGNPGYLQQRCHLIGFQLAGENANEKNLITGTEYFNVTGMLPFENEVADYVKKTGHHVLYRVTPIYEGDNLVASGVLMEAGSVEDDKIRFNVYVYNVEPGISIDYATGDSCKS